MISEQLQDSNINTVYNGFDDQYDCFPERIFLYPVQNQRAGILIFAFSKTIPKQYYKVPQRCTMIEFASKLIQEYDEQE